MLWETFKVTKKWPIVFWLLEVTYLYSCDKALQKYRHMTETMCNTICSSNQKGHKNWGLLLKGMDYIIEWNAPSPVYGLQASWWLFPGSIARVLRLHNTEAVRVLRCLSTRLVHILNGSHEMHSNTVIPLQQQNKVSVWNELDFSPEKKAISHSLSVCWLPSLMILCTRPVK